LASNLPSAEESAQNQGQDPGNNYQTKGSKISKLEQCKNCLVLECNKLNLTPMFEHWVLLLEGPMFKLIFIRKGIGLCMLSLTLLRSLPLREKTEEINLTQFLDVLYYLL